eukprot:gene1265-11352_t
MSQAWALVKESADKRIYTAWMNAHLVSVRKEPIVDLFEDIKSGVKLSELLLILSKEENFGKQKITQNPRNKIQMKENIATVLDFIQNDQNIKLIGIGASDIADGKQPLILSLFKSLIMKYQIENAGSSDDRKSSKSDAKKALLTFLQTEGEKKNIKVENILSSCSDGLLLYALLDSINPDCVEFNDLDKSDPVKLNEQAIDLANQMFKIPPIVNGKDITTKPDEIIIMCYLSYFRHVKYISHVYRSMKKSMGLSTIQPIAKLENESTKHKAKRHWRLLEDGIFSELFDGKKLPIKKEEPKDKKENTDKPKEEQKTIKNPALESLKERAPENTNGNRKRHKNSIVEKGGWALLKENNDKRIFTTWANAHFVQNRKEPISDLYEDVKSGEKLAELLLILSKQDDFGKNKITKNPRNKIQMKENLSVVLDFIQNHEGIRLIGVGATDIAEGKETLILGLFKALIMKYQIENAGSSEDRKLSKADAKKALLNYLQIEGSKFNLKIDNIITSCSDGLLLYALLDSLNPGCIEFNDLNKSDPVQLNDEAIDIAKQMFKIPPIVTGSDITKNPDETIIMCYLSYFKNVKFINTVYKSMKQSMGLSIVQPIAKLSNESKKHKTKRYWRLLEIGIFSNLIQIEKEKPKKSKDDLLFEQHNQEMKGNSFSSSPSLGLSKNKNKTSSNTLTLGNLGNLERKASQKKLMLSARKKKIGPTEEDLRILSHKEKILPHLKQEQIVKGKIRNIEEKMDNLEKEFFLKSENQEKEIEKLKIEQEEKLKKFKTFKESFKEKQKNLKLKIEKNNEIISKFETALKIEHTKQIEIDYTLPEISSSYSIMTPRIEKVIRNGECLQTPKFMKSFNFGKDFDFKIVLIGDDNVGKYSIFKSFTDGKKMKKFLEKPKMIEYHVKELDIKIHEKEKHIKIRVAPILNLSPNLSIHKKHIKSADAVIIVYDITNTQSFSNLHFWSNLVTEVKNETGFVKCIIGNKDDHDEERSILASAALEYIEGEKISAFFETNFKDFEKNADIFKQMGELLTKEALSEDVTKIWQPVDDSSKDCIVM